MKTLAALAVTSLLFIPGLSNAAMSRGEQMKACAAEWAKAHHSHGQRYQHFMRDCLKKMAASQ